MQMPRFVGSFLWFIVLLQAVPLRAQQTYWRNWIPQSDSLVLNIPNLLSESISYTLFPKHASFSCNVQLGTLVCKGRPDSVYIRYTTLPFRKDTVFSRNRWALVHDEWKPYSRPFDLPAQAAPLAFSAFDGLQKNGSISRGISLGNTQNLNLNSQLNLQVSGNISPDVALLLSANDQQIPFQPSGTTAQIQDFDQIFAQLKHKHAQLRLGDIQLQSDNSSQFLKYFKKAQGLALELQNTDSAQKKHVQLNSKAAFTLSKGKFSRFSFMATEQVQGPYRLLGANQEVFITVLSGTERIYMDGKLLQRGQDLDYTIDYNAAEIYFTARQPITKDKRIVTEFQYTDRQFSRSLWMLQETIKTANQAFGLQFYREQDNTRNPLQAYSPQMRDALQWAGDSAQYAALTAVAASDDRSQPLYVKHDTLIDNRLYNPVYTRSDDTTRMRYTIAFAYVGPNKGNYQIASGSQNGRFMQWVQPVNNIPQGAYDTVLAITAPQRQDLLSVTYAFTPDSTTQLFAEAVYSKRDVNMFSTRDKGNDEGYAFLMSAKTPLLKSIPLHGESRIEFNNAQFQGIERFRSVEFDRDWNRSGVIWHNAVLLYKQALHLQFKNPGSYIKSYYEGLKDLGFWNGSKFGTDAHLNIFKTQWNAQVSYLKTEDLKNLYRTRFYRHKASAAFQWQPVFIALHSLYEYNMREATTKLPGSYWFHDIGLQLGNRDSTVQAWTIQAAERRDAQTYKPSSQNDFTYKLKDSSSAQWIRFRYRSQWWINHPFEIVCSWRDLQYTKNITSAVLQAHKNMLWRVTYRPQPKSRLVTGDFFYEAGFGQESRRLYYFQEVPAGQGTYFWVDYNANGLKELNEFEIARFPDQRQYVQVFYLSNTYQNVWKTNWNATVWIRPQALKQVPEWIKRIVIQGLATALASTTDTVFNLDMLYKRTSQTLVAQNAQKRVNMFINAGRKVFSADVQAFELNSIQWTFNGTETQYQKGYTLQYRLAPINDWFVQNNSAYTLKQKYAPLFTDRQFAFTAIESEHKLGYQQLNAWQCALGFKWTARQSQQFESQCRQQAWIAEINRIIPNKGQIRFRMDWVNARFSGTTQTPLAFELLGGLQNGNNIVTECQWSTVLLENIQLNVTYNGRWSEQLPVMVHTGSIQMKALF